MNTNQSKMYNRYSVGKLLLVSICIFASLLVVRSIRSSPEIPRAISLRQAAVLSSNLKAFHPKFWSTANMEENVIPTTVQENSKSVVIQEETISIKNMKIFIQVALPSKQETASGQFVLLLHGAFFSSQTWRDLGTLQLLAAMGHYTVAVDLPGYGKSPSSSVSDKAEFIIDLVKALNDLSIMSGIKLERPVIVSPSMSGGFSIPLLKREVSVEPSKTFMSGFVPVAPVATEGIEDAHNINVPTLIIRGSNDLSLGMTAENNLKQIPSSQVKVLLDADHPAYLKQPELFHKLLYNFLAYLK